MDNQNGSYQSNQCVLDTSQLSNSNKYMNYFEGNLIVPMLITITSPNTGKFNPNIGADLGANTYTQANWAFGLKNWLGSIVHSFTVDMNGTTIIQATSYSGLWNTFQMLTSFAYSDFTSWSNIGFWPDSANPSVASPDGNENGTCMGVGSCNNWNGWTAGANVGSNGGNAVLAVQGTPLTNVGFFNRQAMWNYSSLSGNIAGLGNLGSATGNFFLQYGDLFTQSNANLMYKSSIFNVVNSQTPTAGAYVVGVQQQAIIGIIKLRHLHNFFQEIPLMKGVFFKATLNLNQTYFNLAITKDASGNSLMTLPNGVVSPLGGVNMLCVAAGSSGIAQEGNFALPTGAYALPAGTYTCSLCVGNKPLCPTQQSGANGIINSPMLNSVLLNIPSYTFNPVFETSYLSQSVKTVVYNDIYQYYIPSILGGANFNNLITNGIAGIQSVLVLPFYTTADNAGINPIASPFGMEGGGPTSPLCLINNFNVIVSGAQMIYQTEKYTYEHFVQQLYGYNQLNGGLNDEINSGLITQTDFDMCYNYYYVNCARKLPIEQSVPMSVNIVGTNASTQDIQLYIFVCYQTQISLDVLTGARV
jgi:hypothetical protein